MYTVTFIRQYANASVVYLYSDWDSVNDAFNENKPHSFFQLSIDDTYDCWSEGGAALMDILVIISLYLLPFLIICLE